MTVDAVKLLIGDYSVFENGEKLLEEMILKFDEDASYNDAYLVTKSGTFYLVLEYNDYTRVVNDSFDECISDEDAYSETIENEIGDYFEDCEYDDRFYTMFKPLWTDIYYTIDEYGLNKDEFLNYFYNKNGDGIDYDVVEHFKYCLDRDEIQRFISGNY